MNDSDISKGAFLVLEGLDGSGKSSQMELLKGYLRQQSIPFKDIHFPMLNQGVYGSLVAEFLRGEFGSLTDVHPKLVALLYAEDRKEHAHKIRDWLNQGYLVLADRFVNSNIAFQCAKYEEVDKKNELRTWIEHFEFEHNQLPRPDVSIFLDVPMDSIQHSLMNIRKEETREYLEGSQDIHESDMSFQEKVRREYLTLVSLHTDVQLISCHDEKGNYLPKGPIHQKILEIFRPFLNKSSSNEKING